LDDQEAQSFNQFETPPRKTTPQTRKGEVLQSAGAKSSEKSKVQAGDKSESDSSDSEDEKKQSPKGEVTVPTKTERARSLLAELKTKFKEPDQVNEAKAVEDELERLSNGIAKLNSQEWIAIAEYFAYPKVSLQEQEKSHLIMNAVDSKLHTCFTAGKSRLAASVLMMDLYEYCYGRGETAIINQRKIIENMVKSLGPSTVMSIFSKQLEAEYDIVLAHLEHVHATNITKLFPLTELLQMLATQVNTYDGILGRELTRMIADEESSQKKVTLSVMLQLIERELEVCSTHNKASEASRESSQHSGDKRQGKSTKHHANQALSQRKCHICGSENHLQKDCPSGNQQAINAGKAAAPVSSKSTKDSSGGSQREDQSKKGNARGSGQREPCQICITLGVPKRKANIHLTKNCT